MRTLLLLCCIVAALARGIGASRVDPDAKSAKWERLRGLISRLAAGLASDILGMLPPRYQLLLLPEFGAVVGVAAIGPQGLRHIFQPPFDRDSRRGRPLWFAKGQRAAAYLLGPDSEDARAVVWDVKSGRVLREFRNAGNLACAAAFPDGDRIVTHRSATTCSVWSVESGKKLGQIQTNDTQYGMHLIFPGDRLLMLLGLEGPSIWSVATGRRECTLSMDRGVERWEISPDGRWIVTTGQHGDHPFADIHIWDARSCERLHDVYSAWGSISADIVFLDGGAMLAVMWETGFVDTLHVATGQRLRTFTRFGAAGEDLSGNLVPLPGGRLAVVTARDIRVWNATSGEMLLELQGSDIGLAVGGLAVSPCGDLLAVCDSQGAVDTWNLGTGNLTASFRPTGYAGRRFDEDEWRPSCQLEFDEAPPWEPNSFGPQPV